MNVEDFIKQTIDNISKSIDGISIKYAIDESINCHIIEVFPSSLRKCNKEYISLEYAFWKDMKSKFPEEEFLISEPCILNDMSNVIYEKKSNLPIDKDILEDESNYEYNVYAFDFEIENSNYYLAS